MVEGEKKISIFTDSSILIGLMCEPDEDEHHVLVKSAVAGVVPLTHVHFYVPNIVVMETINRIIKKKKIPARRAVALFDKCLDKELDRGSGRVWVGGIKFEYPKILKRYELFSSKHNMSKLDPNDYMIVTESLVEKGKLLTSDKKLYKSARSIMKNDIYFIGESRNLKHEGARLMKDVLKEVS